MCLIFGESTLLRWLQSDSVTGSPGLRQNFFLGGVFYFLELWLAPVHTNITNLVVFIFFSFSFFFLESFHVSKCQLYTVPDEFAFIFKFVPCHLKKVNELLQLLPDEFMYRLMFICGCCWSNVTYYMYLHVSWQTETFYLKQNVLNITTMSLWNMSPFFSSNTQLLISHWNNENRAPTNKWAPESFYIII